MKIYLTKEQATEILPNSSDVHVFYNVTFGLVGADWDRDEVIDKINNSDVLELTGNAARSMSHGLCAYDNDIKYQSQIMFIETDEEKLKMLERELQIVEGLT